MKSNYFQGDSQNSSATPGWNFSIEFIPLLRHSPVCAFSCLSGKITLAELYYSCNSSRQRHVQQREHSPKFHIPAKQRALCWNTSLISYGAIYVDFMITVKGERSEGEIFICKIYQNKAVLNIVKCRFISSNAIYDTFFNFFLVHVYHIQRLFLIFNKSQKFNLSKKKNVLYELYGNLSLEHPGNIFLFIYIPIDIKKK